MGAVITGHRLLGTNLPVGLTVDSEHCVSEAAGLVAAAAAAQGFDLTDQERVSRAATGTATHLLRYSRTGQIFVRLLERAGNHGVELLATDLGPGMDQMNGIQGLAEIACHVDVFDHFSAPGRGTVMMCRLWAGGLGATENARFEIGSMLEPIIGEEVCGDAWAAEQSGSRLVVLVADGLGHGVEAAAASQAAVRAFSQCHREPVEDIAAHLHAALRGTRGAAIAVSEINLQLGRIRFCGIGNISARLMGGDQHHHLVSQYGIAGYQARRICAYEYEWADGAVLVMHSDGLSQAWDLDAYAGILARHPQLAASTVMRDAPRAADDALVLVVRAGDQTMVPTTAEAADG
jgi:hypothetical protein